MASRTFVVIHDFRDLLHHLRYFPAPPVLMLLWPLMLSVQSASPFSLIKILLITLKKFRDEGMLCVYFLIPVSFFTPHAPVLQIVLNSNEASPSSFTQMPQRSQKFDFGWIKKRT